MRGIVLCAGYGTRLGHLTRAIPKPMLPIQGRPLLEYTLRYLAGYGINQIAINLHFLPEQITDYFGNGDAFGVSLFYSYEKKLLGTAGAVKNIAKWLRDVGDFLVVYGDLLIDQDLRALLASHREKSALATLLLHQRRGSNSLVRMNEASRITGFIERPTEEQRKENPFPWVNSGVYALNSRILAFIPLGPTSEFPDDVFSRIMEQEPIYGFPLSGYRCAIDSPARYEEAKAAVAEGRYTLSFAGPTLGAQVFRSG